MPHGGYHLAMEPQAVLERAAVPVLAVVHERGIELVEQVRVRGVDLDAVEPGILHAVFETDVTLISGRVDRLKNLLVIHLAQRRFASPRRACHVKMSDNIDIFRQRVDEIALHALGVIEIEQDAEGGAVDIADDLERGRGIGQHIGGAVVGVQRLKQQPDPLLLRRLCTDAQGFADVVDGARDFRLMKREMVDAIVAMGEYNRFSKGIFGWIGFRTKWLPFKNVERVAGETKWKFWGLFKYSIDGIVNFSQAPLSFAALMGILLTLMSFFAILFIVVRRLVFGDPVAGWASTACFILFMGGLQLMCMGIIGQYLAKTYLEVKRRPHYIVAETNDKSTKLVG